MFTRIHVFKIGDANDLCAYSRLVCRWTLGTSGSATFLSIVILLLLWRLELLCIGFRRSLLLSQIWLSQLSNVWLTRYCWTFHWCFMHAYGCECLSTANGRGLRQIGPPARVGVISTPVWSSARIIWKVASMTVIWTTLIGIVRIIFLVIPLVFLLNDTCDFSCLSSLFFTEFFLIPYTSVSLL